MEDPLNWSERRKRLALACMLGYTVAVGISSAATYSVLENVAAHTRLALSTLNQGTGYMFLAFGWSCLLWHPLALQYGKRPIYLVSLLGTLATMIWAPYATSKTSWIMSKILQGFFGAPMESVCGITLTDLYFTHERGFYTTIYALVLSGSSTGAPIFSGAIADTIGWGWVLHWCATLCALVFCVLFFLMEETNYHRTLISPVSPTTSTDYRSPLASPMFDLDRKADDLLVPLDQAVEWMPTRAEKKKPWHGRLQLWRRDDLRRPSQIAQKISKSFHYATFPVSVFCSVCYGSSLVWYNLLNATASVVLTEVYHFSTSMIGATYVAVVCGVFVGAAYTGFGGDRYTMGRARRRAGIAESEDRLWLLLPAVVVLPGGFVLWGVGAAHHIHWAGMVVAMFLITVASAISVQESINYCIRSYPDAEEAIITVILIRNTMSFMVGYGLTPWVANLGFQNAFVVAACVACLQASTVMVMIGYGKQLRRRSAARYRRYTNDAIDGHFS